jgi:hypothetical protein
MIRSLQGHFSADKPNPLGPDTQTPHGPALVEHETIRSIIEGFVQGRIRLPKVETTGRDSARIAPSFMTKGKTGEVNPDVKIYSAHTLHKFLGWSESKIEAVPSGSFSANHAASSTVADIHALDCDLSPHQQAETASVPIAFGGRISFVSGGRHRITCSHHRAAFRRYR